DDAVLDDMPAVLALLERAYLDGRPVEALRLARAAEPWLSTRQRWAAWGLALAIALACAHELGDAEAEGWALHQLGVRWLGLGRSVDAQKFLERAVKSRERANDQLGAQVSRENLRILQQSPPLLPRLTHSRGPLVGVVVVAAILIGLAISRPGASPN